MDIGIGEDNAKTSQPDFTVCGEQTNRLKDIQCHPELLGENYCQQVEWREEVVWLEDLQTCLVRGAFLRGSFHDWVGGRKTKLAVICRQWMDVALLVMGEIIRKGNYRKRTLLDKVWVGGEKVKIVGGKWKGYRIYSFSVIPYSSFLKSYVASIPLVHLSFYISRHHFSEPSRIWNVIQSAQLNILQF